MTGAPSPERWAIDISLVLNAVLGKDRFPVDVVRVAKEYSAQRFPDDPVSLVIGQALPDLMARSIERRLARKAGEFFTTARLRRKGALISRSGTSSGITSFTDSPIPTA